MSGLQIRNADVETQDPRQLKPGETRRVPTSGIGCERGRVTQAIEQMDKPIGFAALPSSQENKNVETTARRNS
jgi:hypothetical protein